MLQSHAFSEFEEKCIQKNTVNYGGCLTTRKKWLLKINGYEQHPVFASGFHANGLDMYTRFKNVGLAIKWEPSLKLYHPWHDFTLIPHKSYGPQLQLIEWRKKNMQWLAFHGIDSAKNFEPPDTVTSFLLTELNKLNGGPRSEIKYILKKQFRTLKDTAIELKRAILYERS